MATAHLTNKFLLTILTNQKGEMTYVHMMNTHDICTEGINATYGCIWNSNGKPIYGCQEIYEPSLLLNIIA